MNVYPPHGLCRLGRSVLDDLADAADVNGTGDGAGVDDAEAVAAAAHPRGRGKSGSSTTSSDFSKLA
ncbi:hypothetical protein L484_004279 [Morus notabilis]|uniref:Uncharacterized protein n=1 Tax=Morus notabilis TaxID=981085 RepID=W9R262_9ROSA|nr:hypothetical protein L484_004279 [Morus notabilis]